MEQGVIQWYTHDKGYGYIKEGEKEYFVHYSAIKKEDLDQIEQGQEVSFQVDNNKRMVQADHVAIYRPDEAADEDKDESAEDTTTDDSDSASKAPDNEGAHPQSDDETPHDK